MDICPHCGSINEDKGSLLYKHHLHFPAWKQVLLFVVGLIGLNIIAFIMTMIAGISFRASHQYMDPDALAKALEQYLSSGEGLSLIYGVTYPLLLVILLLVIWKDIKPLFLSFKNWKAVLIGVAGFAVMIGANYLYNLLLYSTLGPDVMGNANQNNVDSMISSMPVLSIFVLGLIGPFVEEITYRVGLFGFTSRIAKWLGYLITVIVFSFIHFDFSCFGNGGQAILVEFVNLPFYIGAGMGLCFLYDRFGFAASYTAHALNNLLSVILGIAGV